jgi:hypothetical protein
VEILSRNVAEVEESTKATDHFGRDMTFNRRNINLWTSVQGIMKPRLRIPSLMISSHHLSIAENGDLEGIAGALQMKEQGQY